MNKKKILKIAVILILAGALGVILAQTVSAEYQIPKDLKPSNVPFDLDFTQKGTGQSAGTTALITVLQILAGALLYVAAPIAVLMMGMTAFNIVMFSGNQEKTDTAKKQFTWAILGLLTIILSYSLVRFLLGFAIGVFNENPEVTQQPAQTQEQSQ
jgi:hypothetical protein